MPHNFSQPVRESTTHPARGLVRKARLYCTERCKLFEWLLFSRFFFLLKGRQIATKRSAYTRFLFCRACLLCFKIIECPTFAHLLPRGRFPPGDEETEGRRRKAERTELRLPRSRAPASPALPWRPPPFSSPDSYRRIRRPHYLKERRVCTIANIKSNRFVLFKKHINEARRRLL